MKVKVQPFFSLTNSLKKCLGAHEFVKISFVLLLKCYLI